MKTDDELRGWVTSFHYDVIQLCGATSRLQTPPPDPIIRNALVESALLAARRLAEFFGGTAHPDDVIVLDVDPKATLTSLLGTRSKRGAPPSTDLDWIDKRLTHCSPLRDAAGAQRPPWHLGAIVGNLAGEIERLAETLCKAPPPWLAALPDGRAKLEDVARTIRASSVGKLPLVAGTTTDQAVAVFTIGGSK